MSVSVSRFLSLRNRFMFGVVYSHCGWSVQNRHKIEWKRNKIHLCGTSVFSHGGWKARWSNMNANANRNREKKREKVSNDDDDDELVTYEWTGNYVIPHPPGALKFAHQISINVFLLDSTTLNHMAKALEPYNKCNLVFFSLLNDVDFSHFFSPPKTNFTSKQTKHYLFAVSSSVVKIRDWVVKCEKKKQHLNVTNNCREWCNLKMIEIYLPKQKKNALTNCTQNRVLLVCLE